MHLLKVLSCLSALVLAPNAALGLSIGLFTGTDCGSCNLSIPLGETRTLYIAAESGSLQWGGAEFRVAGLPAGWTAASTPVPEANLVLGDPFGSRVNIGFDASQSGDCTILFSVAITANTAATDVVLRIAAGDPPSNPNYDCPLLVPENEPCFCNYCVSPGEVYINSGRDCTVGVDTSTWSQLKQRYE